MKIDIIHSQREVINLTLTQLQLCNSLVTHAYNLVTVLLIVYSLIFHLLAADITIFHYKSMSSSLLMTLPYPLQPTLTSLSLRFPEKRVQVVLISPSFEH